MPAGKRENKALLKQVPSSGYVSLLAKHPAKHPPTTQAVFVLGAQASLSPACAQSQLSPKDEEDAYIKHSSTLLSFLQKVRTARNAKRHFAFDEKTFALRVRVTLMNIWVRKICLLIKSKMWYNVKSC